MLLFRVAEFRTKHIKNIKTIIIIIICCLIILFIYGLATAFDPQYENAEINQNIGGTLICNSIYNSDHHSWQYYVNYTYKINDILIDIGSGTFYGREWKKDEQIVKFKNLLILKTGGWIGYDKILIIDENTRKINEYEFSPENIEREDI
ncbi:MAG: hypothetical protein EOO91_08185 [Pedobacter sp.]|nr:MAG: hypothetical protein EOO91_08185 [Pedobacter sp.]